MQMSEIDFYDENMNVLSWNSAVAIGGNSPARELPDRLYDNNAGTKWLDKTMRQCQDTVLLQTIAPLKAVYYSITSANDFRERDPVLWDLQVCRGNDCKLMRHSGESPESRETEFALQSLLGNDIIINVLNPLEEFVRITHVNTIDLKASYFGALEYGASVGQAYEVTVDNEICVVENGNGIMGESSITVTIVCGKVETTTAVPTFVPTFVPSSITTKEPSTSITKQPSTKPTYPPIDGQPACSTYSLGCGEYTTPYSGDYFMTDAIHNGKYVYVLNAMDRNIEAKWEEINHEGQTFFTWIYRDLDGNFCPLIEKNGRSTGPSGSVYSMGLSVASGCADNTLSYNQVSVCCQDGTKFYDYLWLMGIGSDATDEIYDDQLNALSQILSETYVNGITQSSIVQFAESIDINHEFLDVQTAQTVSNVMKNLPIYPGNSKTLNAIKLVFDTIWRGVLYSDSLKIAYLIVNDEPEEGENPCDSNNRDAVDTKLLYSYYNIQFRVLIFGDENLVPYYECLGAVTVVQVYDLGDLEEEINNDIAAQPTFNPTEPPFETGVEVTTITIPGNSCSDSNSALLFTPLDISRKYPIISFAHGWMEAPDIEKLKEISAAGYVIIAPNGCQNSEIEIENLSLDQRNAATWLLNQNMDIVDAKSPVSFMGHSVGGGSSVLSGSMVEYIDYEVGAIVSLMPFVYQGYNSKVPIFFTSGNQDIFVEPFSVQEWYEEHDIRQPKMIVTGHNVDHHGWNVYISWIILWLNCYIKNDESSCNLLDDICSTDEILLDVCAYYKQVWVPTTAEPQTDLGDSICDCVAQFDLCDDLCPSIFTSENANLECRELYIAGACNTILNNNREFYTYCKLECPIVCNPNDPFLSSEDLVKCMHKRANVLEYSLQDIATETSQNIQNIRAGCTNIKEDVENLICKQR